MDINVEIFVFENLQQRLYCSKNTTTATNHDMTGIFVWPASNVFSWYLTRNRDVIAGKDVLEVGAGCGLVGFISKQCGASSVTITDGNKHVLGLLNKTHSLNGIFFILYSLESKALPLMLALSDDVRIRELDWSVEESVCGLLDTFKKEEKWPTVIIGSGVFQESFGSPGLLFRTVKRIFMSAINHGKTKEECVFYVCFGLRPTTKDDVIAECAKEEGFDSEKRSLCGALPEGMKIDDFSKWKLRFIKYTLN